jgi:4-diphosphocytidyl-2-C-methyl-D-erythritol kinase
LILAVPARAKLNLDLEVVGLRADGFHELRTTFQAIDLHDLIEIQPANKTQFEISGFDVNPNDFSVLKAHRAVERAAKTTLPVKVSVIKRIPPGSGMGGASSDAAATLKGLQAIFRLDKLDLHAIAAELGSDVPFFLTGGRARAEGRGERLLALESGPTWFAIAWPGYELTTARVYEAWDGVKGERPNELRNAAEHVEPRLREFAGGLGPGWQMTGSGSAFFKAVPTATEAQKAVTGLDCWTTVAAGVSRWG